MNNCCLDGLPTPAVTGPAVDPFDPCQDAQRVIVCAPPVIPVDAPATTCNADTTVKAAGLLSQAVHTAPGTALQVKLCEALPPLKIEFSETKLYSASTELGLFRIREYNEDSGAWTLRYENLDGTPYTGTLPTDLTAISAQIDVTRTTVLGCADGVPYAMRETARFDAETGALESEVTDWVDSAGVATGVAPVRFVIGDCPPIPEDKWVVEKACYGIGDGATLLVGDVLYVASSGVPLGASHGATSVSDSYLHAMYAISGGSSAGVFNADDATSPFDCSTHGGVLLSDSVKVQAATDAAVAALEVADGVPSGTYKATYHITTSGQAVWAYNAALAAVSANSYLHPYTGSDTTFCNYQEKHDVNVVSTFTEADLGGKFPIEVTKLISPKGDILQRRVWDDRTEPPTEIIGFDPALIGECAPTPKTEFDVVVSNWLPLCVDGAQWFVRESQVVDNNLGTATVTTKEYKQGADGAISTTAPIGVVVQGNCAPAQLTQKVQRLSSPFVVATGYKSVSVTAFSANVTIDGVLIPNGFTWSVDGSDGETFSAIVSVAGSDYIITEVR